MAGKINSRKSSKRSITTVFLIWWFLCACIQVSILNHFGVVNNQALADAAISNILLALFCLFVMNNMRYYLPKKEKYLYVLFMSFALSALWLAITNIILKSIYKTDYAYLQLLKQSLVLRCIIAFLMIGWNTLLSLIWYTNKDQNE